MASPYFSKINLHQQDFSVLQNAGRAWGEAYQKAGEAIGQLGSAYFKRQGMMKQAEQFAKSEMGQEYLRGQGMPPATAPGQDHAEPEQEPAEPQRDPEQPG